MMRKRIGAIIINQKKLLLVSGLGSDTYWTPGGKSDEGETPKQTLSRELKEELNIELKSMKLVFSYAAFETKYNSDTEFSYYLIEFEGKINPSNEIDRVIWLTSDDIKNDKVKVSEGVKNIFSLLIEKKLI